MNRDSDLLREVHGGLATITLNRPKALNSITLNQLARMHEWLSEWVDDSAVTAIALRGAGDKALCAGGDVRAVYEHRGDRDFMHEVYRIEYVVDRQIFRYPKPYIAFMDGIVMGGGCGISVHGSHRIVTEKTVFAMPETAIGLFPDVAGCYFLARCPGHIGEYLALTGARLSAADMIFAGLADAFVPRAELSALHARMCSGYSIEAAISAHSADPGRGRLLELQEGIDRCFGKESVIEIVAALEREGSRWADEARSAILANCPFSQVATLRALREARRKSMEEVLTTDFRLAQRFMSRDDYFEGVRARIVDKDNNPRWNPARLEDVDLAEVDRCFAPLPERDIDFSKS